MRKYTISVLVFVVGSVLVSAITGMVTYIKKVDATELRVQTLEDSAPEIKKSLDKLDKKIDENNQLIVKVIMSK